MPRVTLQTIADEVGVSRQTVSNAFSRPDQLSGTLRARILDVADALGYRGPDPTARALAVGRTGVVGVVLTERTRTALVDASMPLFLSGVAAELGRHDQDMLVISGAPDEPDSPSDGNRIRRCAVDGLIAFSLSNADPLWHAMTERGVPLVVVDQPRTVGIGWAGIDDRLAARLAVAHLVGLGHERIGILVMRVRRGGVTGMLTAERRRLGEFPVTEERLLGAEDALGARELAPVGVWECATVDDVPAGVAALVELGVTAIFAHADTLALAALAALRSRGVHVPGAMSVVGLDDAPAAAAAGLTTVHQPHEHKGAAAVRLLAEPSPGEVLLPVDLRVRASTGPPC
ncbi:MAG: LacI family DNA-binding transcriptional regulator [Actinomycetota bacterium]|nr:LacI family DNA-binding transcriptional regulator [Actinomycetota bacterium]